MISLGIDPGLTNLSLVGVEKESVVYQENFRSKKKGYERLLDIERKIRCVVDELSPGIIALEAYSFASKYHSHQMGELGWAIRRNILDIEWILVHPTSLKKFATGKGNSPKDIILQQVYKRWGIEFTNNNIADAFVLAKIGQAYKEGGDMPAFQKEVIKNLKKKHNHSL